MTSKKNLILGEIILAVILIANEDNTVRDRNKTERFE